MNKQLALIAFTILFLLGMVNAAWGVRLNGVVMNAPTVDPNIAAGGNFPMSGQVSTRPGSETWTLDFQWDQGTGSWTNLTGSGELYTSNTNPITGSPTGLQTITVVSNGTAGNYQVRVQAIGSVTGTYTSTLVVDVTVVGGGTTTTTTSTTSTSTTTTTTNPSSACTGAVYVDGDNGSPSSPYSSWATAATDISTGIGAASSGQTVCVRASTATYDGAFTMVDGIIVSAEYPGVSYPQVYGTVTFSGDYTAQTLLDGVEIVNQSPSIYMQPGTGAGINNNVILRRSILNGGQKPGIKHEGGAPIIENNVFTASERPGIRLMGPSGTSTEAMIIRDNEFYGNSTAGTSSSTKYHTEIFFEDTKSSDPSNYVLLQGNLIHNNDTRAGINFDTGNHYAYLTGNEIYSNPLAGIHIMGEQFSGTSKITISGEQNFTFAGVSYTDGSPNIIRDNGGGGIVTEEAVTMDIISNDIYDNQWGGISTDKINPSVGYPNYVGFTGTLGSAVLDIRKNYIHGNGKALNTIGGGINVRAATATIKNNVIYENNRAGIRVGDYAVEISNNTLVANGNVSDGMGGGIAYDSQVNTCMDCQPSGTLGSPIPVKNNIIAYNEKAALIGMGFTNTLGSEERDYNLVYANNPGAHWMTNDCGYVAAGGDYSTEQIDFMCLAGQYGFQPLYWDCWQCPGGKILKTQDPGDILDDPVFVSMTAGSEDYQLDTGSPGIGAGEGGIDMGAWGGTGTFTTSHGTYNVYMDWSHGLPH